MSTDTCLCIIGIVNNFCVVYQVPTSSNLSFFHSFSFSIFSFSLSVHSILLSKYNYSGNLMDTNLLNISLATAVKQILDQSTPEVELSNYQQGLDELTCQGIYSQGEVSGNRCLVEKWPDKKIWISCLQQAVSWKVVVMKKKKT